MVYKVAGALAVLTCTADFLNPRAFLDILDRIQGFLKSAGVDSLSQFVGVARVDR
ncbi:MAG: hypothetical protein ACE5JL_02475 [Dehalococcoidia bacterium]